MDFLSEKEREGLRRVGVHTAGELLRLYPKRYEDRRQFDAFPAQAGGDALCLRGLVVDSMQKRFGGGKGYYEVILEEPGGENVFGGGSISCRWFNMPFVSKMVAVGHEVIVYGRVKDYQGRLVMEHPEFEIVSGQDSLHLDRIVPIYRGVSGLPQRKARELMARVLEEIEPASLAASYDVDRSYPRLEAFREIHFPDDLAQTEAARRRFALEEFFALQLTVRWRRLRHEELVGRAQGKRTALLTEFYQSLPFDLTAAQKRSVKEIIADMRSERAMNRLLQGDVGSGKTFVALCAMVMAVDSGHQAALMAPTQILAEQHWLTFSKWLQPLGVKVGLLTGARDEESAEADILIGTHALLFERAHFERLSLVVIDEQHKFGVLQRGRLIQQGRAPDVLVMTATPIPRTLTLTIYGDLDVSVLDERPAGRGRIVTGVREKPKVSEVTAFLKGELAKGRQVYLVYPLVEDSDSVKAQAAVAEFPKWQKRLKDWEVELLHGKLAPEEKDAVMARFRANESQVLVATTVIEVGVDVPNANVMIIWNAERFGLAQLHQLRGRIGRGEHKSYCILATDGKSGQEKLAVMAETDDGFRIAEADLALRGPGEVLGTMQSGLGELQFAEFLADPDLVREARRLAEDLLKQDPLLENYPELRRLAEEATEIIPS
ncbi:ATP-dependent DNA helicase RecG [Roseibacillus ishigakijimensis]|uniref:ATP-dependent DNA helicase RecG n=1 Tax=Roseibacillus ishigakijimensis TaxID=454146 RepID=A0A934RRX8_9BACT|nr:ATP-dependent DNA helicase RecG [Roseibacillus ishigakijimensis]MBK1834358.1 ATP-dependent DNA helicase RecG [Roseibacillus ishigakijimensis]